MALGQIYKIHSDFYYVDDGNCCFECKIREVLKKKKEQILVGDYVEFDEKVISRIINRKNQLMRPNVANVDQIVIVSAMKEPNLNFSQLNRYIALSEYHKIKPILCFNKNDLKWDKGLKTKIDDIYKALGYKIIYTSAIEYSGITELKRTLEDKTTVLCGNSGVGKSSITNAINPDIQMRTKEVSKKTQKGTHTTRHCEIVKIGKNSRLVDTPGFSNVKFDFIMPENVIDLFCEMVQFKGKCKYSNCLHINENGCFILDNIDKIDKSRYESYLSFVNEAQEYKNKIKNTGIKTELHQKNINDKQFVKISEKKRQSARNTLKQQIYKELTANAEFD